MTLRWPISLLLALLVTGALAVGIAAGIQALLPLMASKAPPWLPAASLLALMFGPITLLIHGYRRRHKEQPPKQG